MKAIDKQNRTKVLLMSAFSLATCILCLLVFRGPLSIASALLIPAVIVVFSKSCGILYHVLTSAGMIAVTFLFFQAQVFFVIAYILLSFGLRLLLVSAGMEVRFKPFRVIIFVLLATAVLYIGIRLTEWVFLVPLHKMMLSLSGYNDLRYFAMMLAEGTLVFVLNAVILKALFPKIRAAVR